jgi:DNA-binding NarL/FixJ family response regulator
MAIHILIVEDHALVGSALCRVLAATPDLEVDGMASSIDEAVDIVRRVRPDVALVDLCIGRERSIDRLAELRSASPSTSLLILTAWPTEHGLETALAAGARGLLSKTQPFGELVDGVRRAERGEVVVCPDLVPVLVRRATAPSGRTWTTVSTACSSCWSRVERPARSPQRSA